MSLFAELRRRNVFRVGTAYLVLAWLVIQVTDTVAPALNLPDWTLGVVIWIGITGFPFALIFSWAFELTPEGLKREEEVPREVSETHVTGRRIDRIIVGLLALVVGFLLVDRYYLTGREATPFEQPAAAVQPVAAKAYNSIAVLPFVNMSNDAEQVYFSDGISEELLNLLARIEGLKVAARTSSFAFRGKEQDIRDIGTKLNVDTVLEGSVRKSGNRIRVTAQLISAADGYHLWSDNFDRELTDIFQIQDDISDAIVDALRVHIDPDYQRASTPRTNSLEAYDLYLQGRHLQRTAQFGATSESLELFRRATEVDPDYAPAWAASAVAVVYLRESAFWDGMQAAEVFAMAQEYIDRALALDPDLAEAYVAESALHWDRYRFADALAAIDRALALNFSLAVAHFERSRVLESLGRIDEANRSLLTAAELDPLDLGILMRAIDMARDYRDLALLEEVEQRLTKLDSMQAKNLLLTIDPLRAALQEKNRAAVYKRFTQAVEAVDEESAFRRRMEYLRADFGLEISYRPEYLMAQAKNPPLLRLIRELAVEGREAEAWARYEELPPALRESPVVLEEVSILQMREGNCEAGLATLEKAHGGRVPIYGQVPPSMHRSNANLAANRVFCLRQLGRAAEAEEILTRLRPFVDNLSSSAAGGYEQLQIKFEVLDGRPDVAMGMLEDAVRQRSLSYMVWADPIVSTLQSRPEYGELRQWLTDTINAERAELGWPATAL